MASGVHLPEDGATMDPMGQRNQQDADELVWTLFGVRVSICNSEGAERSALEKKEHELVEELSDLLDPHVHVDLPKIVVRPEQPPMF